MKKQLLLLSLTFLTIHSYGQITFENSYNDATSSSSLGYSSAQQTFDSGYVLLGTQVISGQATQNIVIIKTDSKGSETNVANIGGADFTEAKSVQQTYDGGYIICGHTNNYDNNFDDVYLIKTDASFDTLWTRLYGGVPVNSRGNSVRQTSDSGFIVTGVFDYTGQYSAYLIKTDKNGKTIFNRAYALVDSNFLGMEGVCVQQTADKGYIISGFTSLDYEYYHVYLLKTDSVGNVVWNRIYGGTGTEIGNSIQQTFDGGYIVAGYTTSFGNGRTVIYLIKTDAGGDTLWSKTYSTGGEDEGWSVQQTPDSGYIVSGTCLLKTDSHGNLLWSKSIGGVSIQQTLDGGYIMSGQATLIKTDTNGNTACANNSPAIVVAAVATQVTNPVVTIDNNPSYNVTPAFQILFLDINENACTPLSVENVTANDVPLIIYPNPASYQITLHTATINAKEDITVSIINVLGEVVHEEKGKWINNEAINIKALSQGIYVIQIVSENNIWKGRFVKE